MKDGPDIARIAATIGDPARANMLTALMSGKALTPTELAQEAGVTPQTASTHIAKLEAQGLLLRRRQGRHSYLALANDDVAGVLEALMGLAAKSGHMRTRTGPRDPALRRARACYDHLAGEMGTDLFDAWTEKGFLKVAGEQLDLTSAGAAAAQSLGVDLDALRHARAPLCRACLDWSMRRSHLAGSVGRALLRQFEALGWAARAPRSRVVRFSPDGERRFYAFLRG